MGRKTISTQYLQPIDASGNTVTAAPGADANLTGRGVYTLAANTTYYFIIGGQDARVDSFELEFDNAIVITTANIEDTDAAEAEVSNFNGPSWAPETPSTAYVGVKGAGSSAANGTLTTIGTAQGCAVWHIADTGARRTRIAVVVGATGGEVRGSCWGKE